MTSGGATTMYPTAVTTPDTPSHPARRPAGRQPSGDTLPTTPTDDNDRLLTPAEVATLFRVDPKTVTRWAAADRIPSIRTPGGHRRFRTTEVHALLDVQPE